MEAIAHFVRGRCASAMIYLGRMRTIKLMKQKKKKKSMY